jgi:hypothetical protein
LNAGPVKASAINGRMNRCYTGPDIEMKPGRKPYKIQLALGVSQGEHGIVGYRPMCRDVPIAVSS